MVRRGSSVRVRLRAWLLMRGRLEGLRRTDSGRLRHPAKPRDGRRPDRKSVWRAVKGVAIRHPGLLPSDANAPIIRSMKRTSHPLAAGFCLVAILVAPTLAQAAPGDLDPSFGADGKVTTDFGGMDDEILSMAI